MQNMNFWERVLFLLQEYGPSFLRGAGVTMVIALVSTFVGCIIGFAVGVVQTIPTDRKKRPVHWTLMGIVRFLLNAYVEIFRGTPMMVQAMFIFYGMAALFSINLGMWEAAFLIVSINTGAYMAETVRGGIISVDPGQTEGAKAIGMTHVQTMVSVILPQAFRNIVPQIGNNFIINIKDTSVMFIISFTEFFAIHRTVVGSNYLYFPSAAIEMVGYLTMTLIASFLLRLLEKKLDGNDSYDLVQVDALTMSAGTYNYPGRGTPFDERNPEAQKSMLREELRRQAERDAAVREGQKAETRRAHGNETRNQDGGDQ